MHGLSAIDLDSRAQGVSVHGAKLPTVAEAGALGPTPSDGLSRKLQNLPAIVENFVGWHIPAPQILAPFVSGVEFFGGLFLLIGFMTRISAGALGVAMIVAIVSAKWDQVDSVLTLIGFDETEYLAIFLWLAIAGAGLVSVDQWIRRFTPGNPKSP